ncbi:hypothetical protein Sjap_018774 [Stephania japonica]|uniref:Uncharacterized protein n=1 Tax=Stephania japonica TaxID=461633 RepID=A0AAP0I8N0_9MAGN
MNGRLAEVSEIEQTPELREKIFKEVMGQEGHGHVRTYGLGPSYRDVFGSTSNVPADVTIQALRNEVMTTNAKVDSQQMLIDSMVEFLAKSGFRFSP